MEKIIKNSEEKDIKEMSKDELKEALIKWTNLHEFGPEMIEETHDRIVQANKEKNKPFISKKRKEEIEQSLNALQYVFMQTQKNVEVSASMIHSINDEIRLRIRQELADVCRDSLI